jgi:nucleoside-diphosphate-sugar epimerase
LTILGTSVQPIHTALRLGDVEHSAADIELARRELGYEPQFSLEEGLRTTAEFVSASLI